MQYIEIIDLKHFIIVRNKINQNKAEKELKQFSYLISEFSSKSSSSASLEIGVSVIIKVPVKMLSSNFDSVVRNVVSPSTNIGSKTFSAVFKTKQNICDLS